MAELDHPSTKISPEPIAADIACAQCGYNLRGLTRDRRCPECSVDIADSLRADRLLFADPRWLVRTCRGAGLVAISAAGLLCTFLLLMAIAVFMPLAGGMGGMTPGSVFFGLLIFSTLLSGMFMLLFIAGTWVATLAEPGVVSQSTYSRWLPRISTLVFIPALAAAYLTQFPLWGFLAIFGALMTVVGVTAHMGKLLKRIPNRILSRRSSIFARAFAYCTILWIVIMVLQGRGGQGSMWAAALVVSATLCFLGSAALILVHLVSCRKALKQALLAVKAMGRSNAGGHG